MKKREETIRFMVLWYYLQNFTKLQYFQSILNICNFQINFDKQRNIEKRL